ncbi:MULTISPECIES: hypothetical protein [Thalassospira]|jgi:hypothetical protein|uniref:Uncharacterized protein n=1 Tax=Thalassospira marina TaxID=2048283 RepID=A0A2N3KIU0_9PROT|nr:MULTISPECIES: hypothetical protein [Thalassospira]OSQ39110.1 hypothetical protein THS27_21650 [Thalassospira sp. MCCC 1A01428]PKR50440.1 hypothetical protein COO20_21445 [Thalassospira marina]|tara:strand:- start:21189 stop:22076 length:888 start_codon:yes stop_codon:yes gene_type:complete
MKLFQRKEVRTGAAKAYRVHVVNHGSNGLRAGLLGSVIGTVLTLATVTWLVPQAAANMAVFDATNFAKNAAQEALGKENIAVLTSLMDTVGEVAPSIAGTLLADGDGGALGGLVDGMQGWEALSGMTEYAEPYVKQVLGDDFAGKVISADDATKLFKGVFSGATGQGPAPSRMMLENATANIVKRAWTMQGQNQKRAETLSKLLSFAKVAAASVSGGGSLRSQEAVNAAVAVNQTQAIMELHTTMLQLSEFMAMQQAQEMTQARQPGAVTGTPWIGGQQAGQETGGSDDPNVFGN